MEHSSETTLLPLLIVSLLAFLVPIITSWFGRTSKILLPAIVGEILCGIIIGQSFLRLIPETHVIPWLDFLALFGFIFLMFLSGLEIDFGLITSESTATIGSSKTIKFFQQPIYISIAYFLFTLLLAIGVSWALEYFGFFNNFVFIGLILATVSVGVVVPILKDNHLSKTAYGQNILICSFIADFLSMILLTILITVYSHQKNSFTFTAIILIGLLIFILYRLHVFKFLDSLLEEFRRLRPALTKLISPSSQITVRGALALMVTFTFLSQLLGLEVILGAFIAGILLTLILGKKDISELETKLEAIGYGFFIPIFFISVGIDLDIKSFFNYPSASILVLVLILAAFVVKIIPSTLFLGKFNLKQSLNAGILLSSTLSLPIAASNIGLKAGLISKETDVSIIIMAVVTCILAPIIFNKLAPEHEEDKANKIAIIGSRNLGINIAESLMNQKQNLILVALNTNECKMASKRGLPITKASEKIEDIFNKIPISEIRTIIATTNYDKFNFSICLTARNSYNIRNLISIVTDDLHCNTYDELGIIPICKDSSITDSVVNRIISPDVYDLFSRHERDIIMADVWLTNKQLANTELRLIKFPGNTLVVHIKRDNIPIVPHGNTVLMLNDHLTLIGNPDSVDKTIDLLGIHPDFYCPINNH